MRVFVYFFCTFLCVFQAHADDLTRRQIQELTLFGGHAMGINTSISDIKNILPRNKLNELVANGINLNGFLCARIISINPLKLKGVYEVTCIAYRGGSTSKKYVLSAFDGTAFEP